MTIIKFSELSSSLWSYSYVYVSSLLITILLYNIFSLAVWAYFIFCRYLKKKELLFLENTPTGQKISHHWTCCFLYINANVSNVSKSLEYYSVMRYHGSNMNWVCLSEVGNNGFTSVNTGMCQSGEKVVSYLAVSMTMQWAKFPGFP